MTTIQKILVAKHEAKNRLAPLTHADRMLLRQLRIDGFTVRCRSVRDGSGKRERIVEMMLDTGEWVFLRYMATEATS